jgi:hypothetical protein
MSGKEIVLDDFVEAVGHSFAVAQKDVGLPAGRQSAMLISSAELAVKAGLRFSSGKMVLEPVSTVAAGKGGIEPAALSTITIRYVAAQSETPISQRPERNREEIIAEVALRPDLVKLREILGDLTMQANYVPEQNLWTVKVSDAQERTVRMVSIADKN